MDRRRTRHRAVPTHHFKIAWTVIVGVGVVLALMVSAQQVYENWPREPVVARTVELPTEDALGKPTFSSTSSDPIESADRPSDAFPPSLLLINGPQTYPDSVRTCFQAQEWAARSGAVRANSSNIAFQVRGRTSDAVLITNISVRIVSRGSPEAGTIVPGCGAGPVPVRILAANLDDNPPQMRRSNGDFDGVHSRWNLPLKVTNSDLEYFDVIAFTKNCACEWVAEVRYDGGDRGHGVLTIDDSGKPFRTFAAAAGSIRLPDLPWQ